MDFKKGEIILINKPYQWTSFDVVNKLRIVLKKYHSAISDSELQTLPDIPIAIGNQNSKLKVGHAGTLDPLATGLLIICTGKLTKQIDSFQAQEKEYTGSFYLGATTPSFDLETKPENQKDISYLTEELISDTVKKFIGKTSQVPPSHSAVKVDGKRAYKNARKGLEIKIEPREVMIDSFEILNFEIPLVHFRVVCSKGTYIRSLARDFGETLGCGAYLHSLCRTRIGNFYLKDALTVEEFIVQTSHNVST